MSKIILEINNLTNSEIDKGFLKKVGERTLKILSLDRLGMKISLKFSELSLVIVGDKKIKELNKKYRNQNKATDVLAFDYGEIFLCLPQAKRQAKQLGHSLKKELAILLIHGILHLLGYDDGEKLDYNKMVSKQEEIWRKTT